MSQNTTHRPPSTGMGAGTNQGTGNGNGSMNGMGSRAGTGTGSGTGSHTTRNAAWAMGGTLFAGVLMLVSGATDILQGIVAIKKDAVLNSTGNYAYAFNITSWGWIHLGLGVLIALAGLGILTGNRIARYVGIALASLNIVAQFMYLPHQPVWAVVGMALSAFVIWALASDHYVPKPR
ncbi:DUF7144 family membrane protein [Streptomyces sp. NBC_00370]|uniref:DUF7144 family membrane protein n=1 Tax=Streptomyces sp. NBC_00370 TaxID=2975728 RepID=UPI0026D62897